MKAILALLLCLLTPLAGAQPVYRCGNAYSQSPCPDGGRVVDAADPRSAAQRAEAQRVVADEKRLAAEMHRERMAQEKAIRPPGAASLGGPAPIAVAAIIAPHPRKKRRAATRPVQGAEVVVLDMSTARRRAAGR